MNDCLVRQGTPAPDFTLPRSPYASVCLADVCGRRVILAFYPADWEPVSQQQLTLYQEYLAAFSRLGAVLLAISTDHVWCHGAFARAAGLAYPLLSDAHHHGAVTRAYGVYDEQTGLCSRTLFALDEHGVMRWCHTSPAAINPGVDGILTTLEALNVPEAAFRRRQRVFHPAARRRAREAMRGDRIWGTCPHRGSWSLVMRVHDARLRGMDIDTPVGRRDLAAEAAPGAERPAVPLPAEEPKGKAARSERSW